MRRVILLAVLVAVGCSKVKDEGGNGGGGTLIGAAKSGQRIHTREQFRELVMGKTPDEVLKAVGKPSRTSEGSRYTTWFYDRTTKDPVADKVDNMAVVFFENGRATNVSFN